MDLNERRQVGHTALSLPILGLGTCPLAGVYSAVSEIDARATLEAAWELGIRLYDTAPWYGLGQGEHRTGRVLYDLPRDQYTLTTKVGRVLFRPQDRASFKPPAWSGALCFDHHHVFTYDAIMRSYEDSLQRLGINQVDTLYIHDLDTGYFNTADSLSSKLKELEDGGFRALEELKRSGEVKAIGAGVNERGMINRFLDLADLDVFLVASRYTLLEHDIYFDEIQRAGKQGASIVVGGVFNSGILATGAVEGSKYEYSDASAEVTKKVNRLSTIARSFDIALPAAALQFPLAAPEVVSVVFGAVRREEVEQNVAHFNADIPSGFWEKLKGEGLVHEAVPLP
ncbi:aldo/keto reductase [Ochrobactrum quorumnocens]|uniref:Aldo/keto reductase n=1 Tax=Ochrobactrum quorumnocens TaxID=271865 RepID=A0A5N1JZG1_9HYPH|nr:aldo/keto reductase [[Ochrobactrum] quorumnocens]KAA9367414.1 aldo/keto reductase [[Ochrobactrum] quorumnocens]MBD7992237.1 aldo/keto reductase [Ochrobactrum gallinarum]